MFAPEEWSQLLQESNLQEFEMELIMSPNGRNFKSIETEYHDLMKAGLFGQITDSGTIEDSSCCKSTQSSDSPIPVMLETKPKASGLCEGKKRRHLDLEVQRRQKMNVKYQELYASHFLARNSDSGISGKSFTRKLHAGSRCDQLLYLFFFRCYVGLCVTSQ
jgi:hypothetical protein